MHFENILKVKGFSFTQYMPITCKCNFRGIQDPSFLKIAINKTSVIFSSKKADLSILELQLTYVQNFVSHKFILLDLCKKTNCYSNSYPKFILLVILFYILPSKKIKSARFVT